MFKTRKKAAPTLMQFNEINGERIVNFFKWVHGVDVSDVTIKFFEEEQEGRRITTGYYRHGVKRTVFVNTCWLMSAFDEEIESTIVHELTHMLQFEENLSITMKNFINGNILDHYDFLNTAFAHDYSFLDEKREEHMHYLNRPIEVEARIMQVIYAYEHKHNFIKAIERLFKCGITEVMVRSITALDADKYHRTVNALSKFI